MQTIGFLGPAFFLTQLSRITSPAMAVLCMTCSQVCILICYDIYSLPPFILEMYCHYLNFELTMIALTVRPLCVNVINLVHILSK